MEKLGPALAGEIRTSELVEGHDEEQDDARSSCTPRKKPDAARRSLMARYRPTSVRVSGDRSAAAAVINSREQQLHRTSGAVKLLVASQASGESEMLTRALGRLRITSALR
jgi:hypothetical protein